MDASLGLHGHPVVSSSEALFLCSVKRFRKFAAMARVQSEFCTAVATATRQILIYKKGKI